MAQGRNIRNATERKFLIFYMSMEKNFANYDKAEQSHFLEERLLLSGLGADVLNQYRDLIDKVSFKGIEIKAEEAVIHFDMLAALLSEQEDGKIFFQNILTAIHKDLGAVKNLLITSVKDIEAESIDLDIGSNRRVDRFRCSFADGDDYEFTLSADFENYQDDADSNSFVEKTIFSDPLSKDNPWLQKYFGYIKKDFKSGSKRLIAKEYLPGKNIVQYCNEMPNDEDATMNFIDVACETAYTIGGLYKRMDGNLLDDLKLENIIYNYEDRDSKAPACRFCDHSGYYDNDSEKRSASQILAHINSFLTIYYAKSSSLDPELTHDNAVEIAESYLDSFFGEIGKGLAAKFLERVGELRSLPVDERPWELSDDVLDFVLGYDFND